MSRIAFYLATCLFCLLLFFAVFSLSVLILASTSSSVTGSSQVKKPVVEFDSFRATDGTVLKVENGEIKVINPGGSYTGIQKNETVFRYISVVIYFICLLLSGAVVLTIYLERKWATLSKAKPVAS